MVPIVALILGRMKLVFDAGQPARHDSIWGCPGAGNGQTLVILGGGEASISLGSALSFTGVILGYWCGLE